MNNVDFYALLKTDSLYTSIMMIRNDMITAHPREQLMWLHSLILMYVVQDHQNEVTVESDDTFYYINTLQLFEFLDKQKLDVGTFIDLHMFALRYTALGSQAAIHLYNKLITKCVKHINKLAEFCELQIRL